jgi:thioredoxin-dependent peroxiredoxin
MPEVGEQAPDFSLLSTNGEVKLSDALQHSRVLLAFYFENGTPSCTTELRALIDANGMLREAGTQVIAVSADSVASHRAFARRLGGVPFVMASDGLLDAIRAYDVLSEDDRRRARRALFVIERDGTVAYAADPFQTNNISQLEETLRASGVEI